MLIYLICIPNTPTYGFKQKKNYVNNFPRLQKSIDLFIILNMITSDNKSLYLRIGS